MPPPKRRGGGFTLPGFNYLGPFNELDAGPATDELDAAAQRHDQGYQDILDSGQNPYFTYNDADQRMLEETEQMPGLLPAAVSTLWRAKRHIVPGEYCVRVRAP